MARIIASFCVWTIFALLPGVQIPQLCAEIHVDYRQFSEIPEPEFIVETAGIRQRLSQPPCQFLERHFAGNRSVSNTFPPASLNATSCPAETQHGNDKEAFDFGKVSQMFVSAGRDFISLTVRTNEAVAFRMQMFAQQSIGRQISHVTNIFGDGSLQADSSLGKTYPVNLPTSVTDEPELELESTPDEYWQYYEDCDHWDVIFAIIGRPTHSLTACLNWPETQEAGENSFSRVLQELATRNWLQLFHSANRIRAGVTEAIEKQVQIHEFRVVECAGIRWKRESKSLASSLKSLGQNQLKATHELVAQIRMPHLISNRNFLAARISVPANALRTGNDIQSRYPSLR